MPKIVLVVEDDPDHRKIVATVLRHHGYQVLEAADGVDALRQAQETPPQLVIMDARLPRLDGWETTRRLKAEPNTAGVPVLILSAHTLDQHRDRAQEVGCDAYLAKPCAPLRVVQEVQRLVGAASET